MQQQQQQQQHEKMSIVPSSALELQGPASAPAPAPPAHLPKQQLSFSSSSSEDHLPLLRPDSPAAAPQDDDDDEPAAAGGAGLASAVFNLATTIIGAGIMALPATMKVLGLPLGLVAIVAMGLVSEASLEMLVLFSSLSLAKSYGDTVQRACGSPAARRSAEACIILNNAGVLVVYLIIIGEVLSGSPDHQGLLQQWLGPHGWWSSRSLVIFLALALALAPLCFFNRIDSLRFSSALSILLAVVFVLLSVGIASAKLAMGGLAKPRLLPDPNSVLDLLVVIPIMTNAFICHFNVHPIYCELRDRTPAAMNTVGRISTLLCVVVYSMTAASGYLLFGDSTASDVLTNFDKDLGIRYSALLSGIIRVGYVVHLMLVFPVIHFSLRQTVDSFFFPLSPESNSRLVYLTLLQLTLSYLGSTVIPNIWIAFQFTGATTGLFLGFVFPALVGLRWWKTSSAGSRKRLLMLVGCWVMLAMAVTVSFIGVTGNIISLATSLHT